MDKGDFSEDSVAKPLMALLTTLCAGPVIVVRGEREREKERALTARLGSQGLEMELP